MFVAPYENQIRLIFDRLRALIDASPMVKDKVVRSTKNPYAIEFSNGSKEGEESYNGGTISNVTINQNYGNFFNYGTITSETLIGGAGTSCFVNHGKIQVTDAYGNSGSAANLQIKNNCWFEAEDDVACKLLQNGANAYFICENLTMSGGNGNDGTGSYLAADNNSSVFVTSNVSLNGTPIVGPSSGDRAYIEFNRLSYFNDGRICPIINNLNLYVAYYNDYYTSWNNSLNYRNYGNGNAQMVGKAAFNTVEREASDCAPAFKPGEPVKIQDAYSVYSYAFEDTNGGDYDMNDVVIKVQQTKNNFINLTIVAVGATLDLNIRLYAEKNLGQNIIDYFVRNVAYYTDTYINLDYNGIYEVHEMFGAEKGVMINTGSGAIAKPITITIPKGKYDPAHLPLAIYSKSQGEMRLAGTGGSPYGIIIPGDWSWPLEQVNITTAYPNFAEFASVNGANTDWYNYANSNSVMNESSLGF